MKVGLSFFKGDTLVLYRALDRRHVVLGCDPDCDICIPDESIAPFCFSVRYEHACLWLDAIDIQHVTVNNEKVVEHMQLAHADVICVGDFEIHVEFIQEAFVDARITANLKSVHYPATASTGVTWLVRVSTPQHVREYTLGFHGLSIGSNVTNDICLDDVYVSNFHARLTLEQQNCVLEDLESTNGTFIGDMRISDVTLQDDTVVRVGATSISVLKQKSHVARENASLQEKLESRLIGESVAIRQVRAWVARVAQYDVPMLITGETGVGKEVVAQSIVEVSHRDAAPFICINCASLTKTLIESELFGHEKGAFTGALYQRKGAFEEADGGTLFLDEIGEMPLEVQAQLLRVLESGEIRRVGSHKSIFVNVRVIAATNRKLLHQVEQGFFREDLYHRLSVLTCYLKPLRERSEDIVLLADHFIQMLSPENSSVFLTAEAMMKLKKYH